MTKLIILSFIKQVEDPFSQEKITSQAKANRMKA